MLERMRKPFFLISAVLIFLALLVEMGSGLLNRTATTQSISAPTPGFGVPYLALIDTLLVFTILLIVLGLFVPERIQGRIQGIASLIVSIIILIASFVKIIAALLALILMLTLLLAIPFGTIAYMALYSRFDVGGAKIALSMSMTLKLFFAGFLLVGHQRFLQIKSLVLLIVTSLVGVIIVSFLHSLPPRFLASITDALAGIIIGILALIWAIFYLIFSLISILRIIRVWKSA